MNKYSIEIENLSYSFGDQKVLENIDILIKKNKFYSIIGPNGSGKTTLLKNISKTLEPDINTLFINGIDVAKMKNKQLAKNVSVVPQNTQIDFEFPVIDVVLMGRTPYLGRFEIESQKDFEIAKKAMKTTNTWELRDKKVNQLSGGESQRVVIARAIAQQTGILLLDEPIASLDIHHQIELMDTLKALNEKEGATIVAVMHDLNLAAQYSDFLFLLDKGKLIIAGKPEDVLTIENIKKVYNMEFCMIENPMTGKPYIIPNSNQFNIDL